MGPQVISHIFGLRKAFGDGSSEKPGDGSAYAAEKEGDVVQGGQWLASDEGNVWLLNRVDEIVAAIGGQEGSNFAKPKL